MESRAHLAGGFDASFLSSLACDVDAMVVGYGEGLLIEVVSHKNELTSARHLSLRVVRLELDKLSSTKGAEYGRIE